MHGEQLAKRSKGKLGNMGMLGMGGGGGGGGYNTNTSCGLTTGLVWNLTSSYTDQSNEASMVSASVIMFILASIFFNLNLFAGLSYVSAILDPKVRLYLASALSLFLPVMSYLFSEAKNAGLVCSKAAAMRTAAPAELSLRARLILTWMLLVELLRKKVEVIRMKGMSGTVERAGRVAWLGSLVFFNLQGAGRKALFGILWLLCAAKLLQRVAFTEVGKRSYAYGKNARVIASYMDQLMLRKRHHDEHERHGRDELLKRCRYMVMGEEKLVLEASPAGYRLADETYLTKLPIPASPAAASFAEDVNSVVTVGKIWELAESDDDWLFTSLDKDRRLRRLCLSFALFKVLRRSFEHLPAMTAAETRDCRDLIFKGLYHAGGEEDEAGAVFQVLNDEAYFLSEYYHSVVPVVFASPFFFFANYILFPLVVLVLSLVVIVLCGNGDLLFAVHSMESDNYSISFGVSKMARCLLSRVLTSPSVFFSTIDFSVTVLLILILVYEEVWEFLVFLLSNWFLVSLICRYTARPQWRDSSIFSCAIRLVLWARSRMSDPGSSFSFKQLSALRFCWLSLMLPASLVLTLPILPTIPVPKQAKHAIMEYLAAALYGNDGGAAPTLMLSNGRSALAEHGELELSPFVESESVAEVILTWHIATSILEAKHPSRKSASVVAVATSLSKYCAYLVAFHPELLPDNQESTESVFEAMKEELRRVLGFWGYHFAFWQSRRSRCGKIMGAAATPAPVTVVEKGASLGRRLAEKASGEGGSEAAWTLLADLWVQLLVYAAPSSDEDCVMGHEKALGQGGEFITVLWALATHTGVSRPAHPLPMVVPIESECVDVMTQDICV